MWPIATPVASSEHDKIKHILHRKKVHEQSILQAAKLKQQQLNALMQLTQKNQQQHRNHSGYESTPKEREQLHIKARERATSNAKQARQELNTLFLRQSEIETSVQSQWEKKIADYEERAVRDEQDEIAALEKRRRHRQPYQGSIHAQWPS